MTPDAARVVVFMPARNTAHLIAQTVGGIPEPYAREIILVDNASTDDTVAVARRLGLAVVEHARDRGYGGSLKTGYRAALDAGADVVVMLHSDYQYDPALVPQMVAPLLAGQADVVLGSRLLGGACLEGGMPLWKYVANVGLTELINRAVGGRLPEFQTGYRAFTSAALRAVPYDRNSDDFLFDMEILVQLIRAGARIHSIPIPTRYMPGVSTMTLAQCVRYGFGVFGCLAGYGAHRAGVRRDAKYDAFGDPGVTAAEPGSGG